MKDVKKTVRKSVKKVSRVLSLLMTALVFTLLVGVTASAAEVEPAVVSAANTGSVTLNVPTLRPLTANGPSANTGIDEVDTMFDNLIGFVGGVARVIGIALVIFGVVSFGIALANHDPGQRAQGLMALAGGVVVFFAPNIITFLQGM